MTDREQRVRELLEHAPGCRSVYGLGATHPHLSAYREQCSCGRDERIRAALLASPPAATNDDDAPPPPSRDMIVLYQARQLLEREGWEYRDGWVKVRVPAAPTTLTEERVEEIATEMRNDVVGDSPGDIGFRSGVGMLMRAILREGGQQVESPSCGSAPLSAPTTRPDPTAEDVREDERVSMMLRELITTANRCCTGCYTVGVRKAHYREANGHAEALGTSVLSAYRALNQRLRARSEGK